MDYALSRPDVDGDNLALLGMSLGGYLAARAAAFEHRFRAAVFFDGVYDLGGSLWNTMPKQAVAAFKAGDAVSCEKITYEAMQTNTTLRWVVTQGTWSFGASGFADFVAKSEKYTMDGLAGQIECPCLVLEAEGDMFFKGQPQRIYDEIQTPKTFFNFSSEDGAENHCQSGALSFKDEVVFNWLDDVLKVGNKHKG